MAKHKTAPVFRAKVLEVFREWPDNEMRAVDVHKWINERCAGYKALSNYYDALHELGTEGWIVRTARDKQGVWWAISRGVRHG